MRYGILVAGLFVAVLSSGCKPVQESSSIQTIAPPSEAAATDTKSVEAGCATCVYNMEGVSGCKLAVKIDGKHYLVTGSDIDDHGDAHAPDGLCHVARRAQASGVIEGDRFVATEFRLVP